MQNKEPEGDILVIDCAYVRSKIADEIAWYESQGYALRSHAVYQTTNLCITMVSIIFIKNHEQTSIS